MRSEGVRNAVEHWPLYYSFIQFPVGELLEPSLIYS